MCSASFKGCGVNLTCKYYNGEDCNKKHLITDDPQDIDCKDYIPIKEIREE